MTFLTARLTCHSACQPSSRPAGSVDEPVLTGRTRTARSCRTEALFSGVPQQAGQIRSGFDALPYPGIPL